MSNDPPCKDIFNFKNWFFSLRLIFTSDFISSAWKHSEIIRIKHKLRKTTISCTLLIRVRLQGHGYKSDIAVLHGGSLIITHQVIPSFDFNSSVYTSFLMKNKKQSTHFKEKQWDKNQEENHLCQNKFLKNVLLFSSGFIRKHKEVKRSHCGPPRPPRQQGALPRPCSN